MQTTQPSSATRPICFFSASVVNSFPLGFGFGHSLLFGDEAVVVEADAPADDRVASPLRVLHIGVSVAEWTFQSVALPSALLVASIDRQTSTFA